MKVFYSSDYCKRFVRPICEGSPHDVAGRAEIMRFSNGEMHATVHEDVSDEECLVIGSVAPPDEQLLALLMLVEALKRNGAARVRAFLPYLGYARQDKFGPGESGGIILIGSLLKAVGVDEVITFDVHSDLDGQIIGLPLLSISTTQLFVPAINGLGWGDLTVIAPDEGAKARAHAVAQAINGSQQTAYLIKKRTDGDGIQHLDLIGEVSPRVLIVDDILDSGRTLISACSILREKDVQEVAVAVTHGLFTDEVWQQLFELGVKTLLVSDSCPEASRQKHASIHVISLAPLLPAVLSEVTSKEW
jgi:ribose-phosphate pyrophosphokinase